jgi:hypothetical protein
VIRESGTCCCCCCCCDEALMEAALVTRVSPPQRSIEPRAFRRRKRKKPGHKKHFLSCPQLICRSGGTERLVFLEFKHDMRRLAVRLLKKSLPFASLWLLVPLLISGFLCHTCFNEYFSEFRPDDELAGAGGQQLFLHQLRRPV